MLCTVEYTFTAFPRTLKRNREENSTTETRTPEPVPKKTKLKQKRCNWENITQAVNIMNQKDELDFYWSYDGW